MLKFTQFVIILKKVAMHESILRRIKPEDKIEIFKYFSNLTAAKENYQESLKKSRLNEEQRSEILEPLLAEIRRVTILLANHDDAEKFSENHPGPSEGQCQECRGGRLAWVHSSQYFYKEKSTASLALQQLKLDIDKNIKNHKGDQSDEKLLKSMIKKPISLSDSKKIAKEKHENLHVKFVGLNFLSMLAFLVLGMTWIHMESIGKVVSFMPEALASSFPLILIGCALLPLAIIIGSYAYQIISDIISKSDKKIEEAGGPSPAFNGNGPAGVSKRSLDEHSVSDDSHLTHGQACESGEALCAGPSSQGKSL